MAWTREQFSAARSRAKKAGEREALRLAAVAVLGGILQLLLIRWADAHLDREPRLWLEGGAFVLYMVAVLVLLRRVLLAQRSAAIACPACGVRLERTSLAVASATGRCEKCGGMVIQ